jgi:hypothetical protein
VGGSSDMASVDQVAQKQKEAWELIDWEAAVVVGFNDVVVGAHPSVRALLGQAGLAAIPMLVPRVPCLY